MRWWAVALVIASDKPLKGVRRFLADAIRGAEESQSVGAALVLLKKNGDVETGYWNMELMDMQVAAGTIQADIIDKIIRANFDQYMGMWNKEGEEDDEGQTT